MGEVMKNGFSFCEIIDVDIFYNNGEEDRFLHVYDLSINGYFLTVLNDSGCRIIETKDISGIHVFKPNKEFDEMFNLSILN